MPTCAEAGRNFESASVRVQGITRVFHRRICLFAVVAQRIQSWCQRFRDLEVNFLFAARQRQSRAVRPTEPAILSWRLRSVRDRVRAVGSTFSDPEIRERRSLPPGPARCARLRSCAIACPRRSRARMRHRESGVGPEKTFVVAGGKQSEDSSAIGKNQRLRAVGAFPGFGRFANCVESLYKLRSLHALVSSRNFSSAFVARIRLCEGCSLHRARRATRWLCCVPFSTSD